jgi:basic membrane lipoprotein Med (substrate-binding protein (PBP1-ABC) superfamily)/DNA-binding SARP family transcriptional activator
MEFRLLGPLEVLDGGKAIPLGGHRQRTVLAALLVNAGHVVSTDRLIDEVWGDEPPEAARKALQAYISRLRGLLGSERLVSQGQGYILTVDPADLDVSEFESLIAEGRRLLVVDPGASVESFHAALGYWRGRPFGDLADEPSLVPEVARLEELRLVAAEGKAEADLALGDGGRVLSDLGRLIAGNPLRERMRALQMQALVSQGRNAEALQAFQDLRTTLAEELGIEPSEGLQRLEEEILTRTPTAATVAQTDARNPYKGLRAFGEGDSGDFHGRRRLVDEVVGRLATDDFLTLVGPSGCGKSSVVAAGLIPALRQGAVDRSDWWTVVRMMPGSHPFASLDVALSRAAGGGEFLSMLESGPTGILRCVSRIVGEEGVVLLVVDQFEELFALVDDEDRRRAFLHGLQVALDDPHSPLRLVATLRADFYGRPLEYPDFAPLFTKSVVNVLPLSAEELREAVIAPAATVGVPVETDLVGAIISDVADQPGALPLFQYSLTELFQRREGGPVSLAAYERLGGLRGALVGRAERIFASFDQVEQEVFRQVAMRLVAVGTEGEATRRRATLEELQGLGVDRQMIDALLGRFGEHRLLSFDREALTAKPTVEVAHEALLREWGRYHEWIEGGRLDLRRRAALTAATRDWLEAGCDEAYLFSGTRLKEFVEWRQASSLSLTESEDSFLQTAIIRLEEEAARELERTERERRLRRSAKLRLRIAFGVALAAVIVGAIALFGFEQVPRVALYYEGEDGSFNSLAANGVRRAAAQLDLEMTEYTPVGTVEGFALRTAAEQVGSQGIVVVNGVVLAEQIPVVAAEYPETKFVVIDWNVPLDNVVSLQFATEEGSYLAGAAAVMASATGKVGFIGGVDMDIIHAFEAGFKSGAIAADPSVSVLTEYLAEPWDFTGFGDPVAAKAAALGMFRDGVDVVFHAAGFSGLGLFEAAYEYREESGVEVWAIGVDADQYYTVESKLRPVVLTSMTKKIDVAVLEVLNEWVAGELSPGLRVVGLGEGVGLATSGGAIDAYLESLEPLRQSVESGEVLVPNTQDGKRIELSDVFSLEEGAEAFDPPTRFPLRIYAFVIGTAALVLVAAIVVIRWIPSASPTNRRRALGGVAVAAALVAVVVVVPRLLAEEFDPLPVVEKYEAAFRSGDGYAQSDIFAEDARIWTYGRIGSPEVQEESLKSSIVGWLEEWTNCRVFESNVTCDVKATNSMSRLAGVSVVARGYLSFDNDGLIELVDYSVLDYQEIGILELDLTTWLRQNHVDVYDAFFDERGDRVVWDQQSQSRLLEYARRFVNESPDYPLTPGT